MAGIRTRDPDPLFYDGRAEDLAILPEDRSSPVTDRERAYYAARMSDEKCVELWGFVLRRAIMEAENDDDWQLIAGLGEWLGLDGPSLLRTASRIQVRRKSGSIY